jgi:hypothetical protein
MIAIGLLLFVLAALLTTGITLFNGEPSNAEAFGVTLSNVSIGALFLTGVITGVVGTVGLVMLFGGGARKRHKRVAAKREVKNARNESATLAEENARLQGQLHDTSSTPAGKFPETSSGDSSSGRGLA